MPVRFAPNAPFITLPVTNWMTAAGIALIAGGIATLIGFRPLLGAGADRRPPRPAAGAGGRRPPAGVTPPPGAGRGRFARAAGPARPRRGGATGGTGGRGGHRS